MANIQALTAQNAQRWRSAKPTRAAFNSVARRLVATKARYLSVQKRTGVPWFVVAVIHEREASQDWTKSIAQGDPWRSVSVHVPKGRGPFQSWEEAAFDALQDCPPYAARWKDWSAGGTLTLLEQYNGLGYAGRGIPSPYIWSGTDQYKSGKYVADHDFRPDVIDNQLGCAGLLLAMRQLDPTILFADEVMPPPDVEVVPTPSKPKVPVKEGSATVAGGSAGAAAHQSGLPWWACIGIAILAAAAVYGAIHYFKRKD